MMARLKRRATLLWLALAGAVCLVSGVAAQVNPDLYSGLQWRNIGPFHGGRVSAVTGVIGQPGVFYLGAPAGGVWKTTSAGVTWYPIFDQFKNVSGIGAIQVAPSDPNVIYVGTGDSVSGPSGDGMYKSTDAGKTWTHVGLEETTKINRILIDPHDPNIVVASTQGDAQRDGRGIYRTTDGGRTWQNTLKPENANGTRDLAYAFDMPDLMFATSQGSGGRGFGGGGARGGGARGRGAGAAPAPPNGTALFKSTDQGRTWAKVESLPAYNGRISVTVAMHTSGRRLYVIGGAMDGGSGLYRSDDQGATWQHMAGDDRRISNGQGGYSSGVAVDPQNPDVVYTVATAVYKSTDGGQTFICFKGAPGGEDPHVMWVDPTNGQRMFFGFDQGPAVTLDGGQTWSGYYQIPISQVYHVSTDTRYPYWVLASQQDTGSVMERSRSDQGMITVVDWSPLPSSEFGTVTADPLHPTTVYGVGYGNAQGGGLIKINLDTGQWGNVAPTFGADGAKYRAGRDFGKEFDTAFDPQALYVGYQCLLVTRDGGQTWKAFSPDLTTAKGAPTVACGEPPPPPPAPARGRGAGPAAGGGGRGRGRGASISDFDISTVKKGVFWTVSSNGQIYNTMDGGLHWTNVSNIPDVPANTTFNTIDVGPADVGTAYVSGRIGGGRGGAANAGSVDTDVPLIWRTHDGGKTWTKIVTGLPSDERTGSWVNVVRADPRQRGLLFCGTETTVYVSFDDGDHWQSLQRNLPTTSIRDMVFHTHDHMNDLVVGTYGRGFWVLDDMSPLRDLAQQAQQIAAGPAYLFKPGDAIRARVSSNWDQPMNPEMPHAPNPPYGALIYYNLSQSPKGEIKLQIFDAAGQLVRTISSIPPPAITARLAYPDYWVMPPEDRALATTVGMHRINWDLRYDDPPGFNQDLVNQMNVAPGLVTPAPHGPRALPGTYTLKLLVDGKTYTQTLVVRNDPRVGQSAAVMNALRAQHRLIMRAYQGMKDSYAGDEEVAAIRAEVTALDGRHPPADVATAAKALDTKLGTFGGATAGRGGRGGGFGRGGRGGGASGGVTSFRSLNSTFNTLVELNHNGLDMAPTQAQIDTWASVCKEYNATVTAWKAMQSKDLAAFNALLTKNHVQPLTVTPTKLGAVACGLTTTRSSGR